MKMLTDMEFITELVKKGCTFSVDNQGRLIVHGIALKKSGAAGPAPEQSVRERDA